MSGFITGLTAIGAFAGAAIGWQFSQRGNFNFIGAKIDSYMKDRSVANSAKECVSNAPKNAPVNFIKNPDGKFSCSYTLK